MNPSPIVPTFTRRRDDTIIIEDCDPLATYPISGALLIQMVERHNAMLGRIDRLKAELSEYKARAFRKADKARG